MFEDCPSHFVIKVLVNLSYNSFDQGMVIQSPNHEIDHIYFIMKGGVAVCESSCFSEPIVVYQKGNIFNMYQNLLDAKLPYEFVAVDTDNLEKRESQDGQ